MGIKPTTGKEMMVDLTVRSEPNAEEKMQG